MNINLDTLVEMVEKQLLLSEDNAQNIYKTTVKLRVNKNVAGETTQVLNEIRGISGVTGIRLENHLLLVSTLWVAISLPVLGVLIALTVCVLWWTVLRMSK